MHIITYIYTTTCMCLHIHKLPDACVHIYILPHARVTYIYYYMHVFTYIYYYMHMFTHILLHAYTERTIAERYSESLCVNKSCSVLYPCRGFVHSICNASLPSGMIRFDREGEGGGKGRGERHRQRLLWVCLGSFAT